MDAKGLQQMEMSHTWSDLSVDKPAKKTNKTKKKKTKTKTGERAAESTPEASVCETSEGVGCGPRNSIGAIDSTAAADAKDNAAKKTKRFKPVKKHTDTAESKNGSADVAGSLSKASKNTEKKTKKTNNNKKAPSKDVGESLWNHLATKQDPSDVHTDRVASIQSHSTQLTAPLSPSSSSGEDSRTEILNRARQRRLQSARPGRPAAAENSDDLFDFSRSQSQVAKSENTAVGYGDSNNSSIATAESMHGSAFMVDHSPHDADLELSGDSRRRRKGIRASRHRRTCDPPLPRGSTHGPSKTMKSVQRCNPDADPKFNNGIRDNGSGFMTSSRSDGDSGHRRSSSSTDKFVRRKMRSASAQGRNIDTDSGLSTDDDINDDTYDGRSHTLQARQSLSPTSMSRHGGSSHHRRRSGSVTPKAGRRKLRSVANASGSDTDGGASADDDIYDDDDSGRGSSDNAYKDASAAARRSLSSTLRHGGSSHHRRRSGSVTPKAGRRKLRCLPSNGSSADMDDDIIDDIPGFSAVIRHAPVTPTASKHRRSSIGGRSSLRAGRRSIDDDGERRLPNEPSQDGMQTLKALRLQHQHSSHHPRRSMSKSDREGRTGANPFVASMYQSAEPSSAGTAGGHGRPHALTGGSLRAARRSVPRSGCYDTSFDATTELATPATSTLVHHHDPLMAPSSIHDPRRRVDDPMDLANTVHGQRRKLKGDAVPMMPLAPSSGRRCVSNVKMAPKSMHERSSVTRTADPLSSTGHAPRRMPKLNAGMAAGIPSMFEASFSEFAVRKPQAVTKQPQLTHQQPFSIKPSSKDIRKPGSSARPSVSQKQKEEHLRRDEEKRLRQQQNPASVLRHKVGAVAARRKGYPTSEGLAGGVPKTPARRRQTLSLPRRSSQKETSQHHGVPAWKLREELKNSAHDRSFPHDQARLSASTHGRRDDADLPPAFQTLSQHTRGTMKHGRKTAPPYLLSRSQREAMAKEREERKGNVSTALLNALSIVES